MKLWINLDRKESIEEYLSMNVETFIVGMDEFSLRHALTLSLEEIKVLYETIHHRAKLYVWFNGLIDEQRLEKAKHRLLELQNCCDGLLFQDFGLYHYIQKNQLSFDSMYSPETLNTNYLTIDTLHQTGIPSFFLSREIPLEDLLEIRKHVKAPLMMALHGPMYLGYSRRGLLSNYFNLKNKVQEVGQEASLTLVPYQSHFESYIYEDQEGTHIMSKERLYTIDILHHLTSFDYGYIDLYGLKPLEAIETISLYSDALTSIKEDTYLRDVKEFSRLLKKLNSNYTYSHGFYFEGTLYRLSDVKEKENGNNQ